MIRRIIRFATSSIVLAVLVSSTSVSQELTVEAGEFDNGKMWTFDYPPVEYFQEEYGFSPDRAWFEKARLGALRLPNCTASFVSKFGLVMTNHHCGRNAVAQVSREGEDLLHDGFVASSLADERQVPGLYVDQLVGIEDVTEEIFGAVEIAETDAEKASARQEAIAAVTERLSDATDDSRIVQVVNLYNGGRYSAYTFKRYSDLRLAMAPELQLGYFGGDTDNFTFPRYALDMTYFRVYQNDQPFEPEHFFRWSTDGASEGDAVFVVGNPGSTNRLETMAQLEWRRDVQEKAVVDLLNSRISSLMAHYENEPSPDLLNQIFGLRNAQKLYSGRLAGLNDQTIMAKRLDTEQKFIADLDQKYGAEATEVGSAFSSVVDDIAGVVSQKLELAQDFAAFLAMQPGGGLASATLGRARLGKTYLDRKEDGATEEELQQIADQISAIQQNETVDRLFLANRLRDFERYFGDDDPIVRSALNDKAVEERVADIMTNSIFAGADSLVAKLQNFDDGSPDPALDLVNSIADRLQSYQSAIAGLGAQETELNAQHGRARFDIYGTSRPPDATFSLRIADGYVAPYEYNGTEAPTFTTFFGLYDRYYSHLQSEQADEWDLPSRWLNPPSTFDKSVQMNLVSTNDIIGGNSGSPLLNKDLEVVGLIFDGNIESLPSAFIYQTEQARTVSVDVRGMLEALDEIYDADRLVLELDKNILVETEAEADAMR